MTRPREPEHNSGIPIEVPISAEKPESIEDIMARMIRADRMSQEEEYFETQEEADDFEEVDPDTIDLTHHQVIAMDDLELEEYAEAAGITLYDDPEAPQEGAGEPSAEAPSESTDSTETAERPEEAAGPSGRYPPQPEENA